MGLFNKKRSDGVTYDGQGEERKGFIDVVSYNGSKDDLLWRFPYDNLSTRTQLVVQEGQCALFLSDGQCADLFTPGRYTLTANNIPILQRIVNLPFGGNSPFKASVIYVNSVTRINDWGTSSRFSVLDPFYNVRLQIGAFGSCGIKISDAVAFVREFSGTLHLITAEEFTEKFAAITSQQIKPAISKYFSLRKVSILEIANHLADVAEFIKEQLGSYFLKYGITLEEFMVEDINADEDDEGYQQIVQAQTASSARNFEAIGEAGYMDKLSEARMRMRAREGYNYQQERQFDVMEGAAQNEGSAGQLMGAGMGIGMGFGVGGAFGAQMGEMANVMHSQPTNQSTPPPPPPPPVASYHVLVNGVQQGPFDQQTLAQLIQNGQLTKQTYVWKQGMAQWALASDCADLQSMFGAVPPPPPTI